MATQLTQTARAAAEKMVAKVINNLRKRSKVGQRMLVYRVDYKISIDEANKRILFRFEFGRVAPRRIIRGKSVKVRDPLFGKIKPWVKTQKEASFTRKLNVYEALSTRYFSDAVTDLADYTGVNAQQTILEIITGNG